VSIDPEVSLVRGNRSRPANRGLETTSATTDQVALEALGLSSWRAISSGDTPG
jgi:hypothetical protein